MPKQISEAKSTKKSWGFPSEKELDDWSNQGKRKSSLFIKSNVKSNTRITNKSKKNINNQEEIQLAFNSSINLLREETKSQKSISSTLSNRLSYYQVDLKRKQQRMQIAKSKYHKMIEVRHKSFIQKKELYKEREHSAFNYSQTARLKASRIKSERKNSQISVQMLRQKNHIDAMKLKDTKFKNQQLIAHRQTLEIEKKRQLVQKSHQQSQVSKEKLNNFQNQKLQSAKTMHKFKMLQQFTKSQMQKRKNTKLMGHFIQKVKKLQQQSKNIAKQLTEYEQLLGHKFSSRNPKQSSKSNSLYLTS